MSFRVSQYDFQKTILEKLGIVSESVFREAGSKVRAVQGQSTARD